MSQKYGEWDWLGKKRGGEPTLTPLSHRLPQLAAPTLEFIFDRA